MVSIPDLVRRATLFYWMDLPGPGAGASAYARASRWVRSERVPNLPDAVWMDRMNVDLTEHTLRLRCGSDDGGYSASVTRPGDADSATIGDRWSMRLWRLCGRARCRERASALNVPPPRSASN
jgi:hypothetical protein